MKHHLATAFLLLIAIALYFAGLAGAGTAAFLAGVAFEIWFWARILIKRAPGKTGSY